VGALSVRYSTAEKGRRGRRRRSLSAAALQNELQCGGGLGQTPVNIRPGKSELNCIDARQTTQMRREDSTVPDGAFQTMHCETNYRRFTLSAHKACAGVSALQGNTSAAAPQPARAARSDSHARVTVAKHIHTTSGEVEAGCYDGGMVMKQGCEGPSGGDAVDMGEDTADHVGARAAAA